MTQTHELTWCQRQRGQEYTFARHDRKGVGMGMADPVVSSYLRVWQWSDVEANQLDTLEDVRQMVE
eukprot:174277-Prymnesium_polylepis.3